MRNLQKPTAPAWAVNQLYWKKRPVYDELIERAADLRATHHAALRGRAADLRGASQAHEEAVDRALKATLALLADSGAPVTDATRQAIATTLRSLPSEEAPGRLSRQLQPRGFEVLEQRRLRAASAMRHLRRSLRRRKRRRARGPDRNAARVAAAREAATAAARASREAEQIARREEFEAARATRDAEKAERRLAEAEQAVEQARAELDEARRAAAGAKKTRETARTRADQGGRAAGGGAGTRADGAEAAGCPRLASALVGCHPRTHRNPAIAKKL